MSHEPKVDKSRLVTVAFLVLRAGRRVSHHGHFEAVFQEIPEVCFDTKVSGRAGEDDLLDAPLAQLEYQVIRRRAVHLMRTGHDRVARVKVWLEAFRPIGPGIYEAIQREWSLAGEHAELPH